MSGLPEKILALDAALTAHDLAHAFGGALALAWCTERPRGTSDIDLNVFVPESRAAEVTAALPAPVACATPEQRALARDGQARLWWDTTPVDLFLSTTGFHEQAARRVHWEPFAGRDVPFLACVDLAVFKTLFDRTRDWADLEDMADAGTLDPARVAGVLGQYLDAGDARLERLRTLAGGGGR